MKTNSDHIEIVATEKAKQALEPPPMYKVVLMNDDYTPMDFVVDVLERFFSMPREQAVQIMLEVHNKGKAVCGIYSKDVAETKVAQVNEYAQMSENPLLCTIEVDS